MANIKPLLDGTNIALEKQAADTFGSAIEDFARGRLGPAQQAIGREAPADKDNRRDGTYYSSSYAAALAGGTSYRPKMKFLFKVEFVFTPEAVAQFPAVLGGANSQDFTFMIKSVDRPKIDFEYEDDVNMYNFRTKVLKKIRHRELTITFMDDTGNRVLNFFRALMMIHSPITRRQMLRENAPYSARLAPPNANSINAGNGMLFSDVTEPTQNDNAIRGVVNSEVGNIIQTIRVKQMYVDPGASIAGAMKEVIFDFLNARLVSFDLDDLSHETSDVNIMTMQFDYDWMEIIQVGSLQAPDSPEYSIAVPGIVGAPIDASPAGGGGSNGANYGAGTNNGRNAMIGGGAHNGQGGGNPFGNILNNQIGRLTQTVSSDAVNRAVRSVAGQGRFASQVGSQASTVLGGLIGAASKNLTAGAVNQSAAGSFLSSTTASVKNLIIPPTSGQASNTVFDSANGGPTTVDAVVTSNKEV